MVLGRLEERIALSVVMHFATEREALAASGLLKASVGITASKTGCLESHLESHGADSLELEYREGWDTEVRFRRHVASMEFKHVLTAIDMCSETPEVKIGKISTTSGVESLREIYFDGVEIPGVSPDGQDD